LCLCHEISLQFSHSLQNNVINTTQKFKC
jgi:hypothetical protein